MSIEILGMPLRPIVREVCVLDRLDLSIVSTRRGYLESLTEGLDRLMVYRVDRRSIPIYLSKYTLPIYLRNIRMLVSASGLIVMIATADILYERTTVSDIE